MVRLTSTMRDPLRTFIIIMFTTVVIDINLQQY